MAQGGSAPLFYSFCRSQFFSHQLGTKFLEMDMESDLRPSSNRSFDIRQWKSSRLGANIIVIRSFCQQGSSKLRTQNPIEEKKIKAWIL